MRTRSRFALREILGEKMGSDSSWGSVTQGACALPPGSGAGRWQQTKGHLQLAQTSRALWVSPEPTHHPCPPRVQLLSPHSPIPATFPTPFSFFPSSHYSLRLFHTRHRGPELLAVIKKKKKRWDLQGSDELGHFQLLIPSAPIHVTDYSGHRASWSAAAPNAPVLLLGDATRGNENDFLCNSQLRLQRLSCLFNFLL